MNTMKAFSWTAGGREGARECTHASAFVFVCVMGWGVPTYPCAGGSGGEGGAPPRTHPDSSLAPAPTEVFGGGDIGEHKQCEVLHDVEAKVEAAEWAVAGARGGAAEVVVPVDEGHQEAGC